MPDGSTMDEIHCGNKPQERSLEQHCDKYSQEFSSIAGM
jgi:hypothetical protein